jgi:hypothetical protein
MHHLPGRTRLSSFELPQEPNSSPRSPLPFPAYESQNGTYDRPVLVAVGAAEPPSNNSDHNGMFLFTSGHQTSAGQPMALVLYLPIILNSILPTRTTSR